MLDKNEWDSLPDEDAKEFYFKAIQTKKKSGESDATRNTTEIAYHFTYVDYCGQATLDVSQITPTDIEVRFWDP